MILKFDPDLILWIKSQFDPKNQIWSFWIKFDPELILKIKFINKFDLILIWSWIMEPGLRLFYVFFRHWNINKGYLIWFWKMQFLKLRVSDDKNKFPTIINKNLNLSLYAYLIAVRYKIKYIYYWKHLIWQIWKSQFLTRQPVINEKKIFSWELVYILIKGLQRPNKTLVTVKNLVFFLFLAKILHLFLRIFIS